MYLNAHTYYSYKYGVMPIQDLLQLASEKGHTRLAVTDVNSTSACINFVRHSAKYGVEPLIGIDFRNSATQMFVGLAKNAEGFRELNEFLSAHLHEKKDFEARAPKFEHALIIYPWQKAKDVKLRAHEYIGVAPNELNRFRFSDLGKKISSKVVLLHSASFRHKRDFNIHRLLRAMDKNMLLSQLPKSEEGKSTDSMLSRDELKELFSEFSQILENTEAVMKSCSASFMKEYLNPADEKHANLQCYSESTQEDERLLRALCEAGLPYRYPQADDETHARVKKELDLIIKKGFVSYFLINWDIINYARKNKYFHVGRGSGANSVVAYLLRITDVDPIELDLYFERFINLFRSSPPDFDIDFSWADREDITNYIFKRFPNSALLGAYSTFQFRAARRELGKVFGLPAHEIETIGTTSRGHYFRPRWEKQGPQASGNDHIKDLVLRYATYLQDMPSHLSIHSCGILISEKPLSYYSASFMPPKGFPTVQYSMLEAEDIRLNKFDILSQRGLGKIKDTVQLVRENHPDHPAIDIHDIRRFKEDEKVKHMLRTGQAIGCFYVESPAMRMLMKKLEVDDYLGLVAASSVIRPGVSQSGMMQTYIKRKREPERRKDAHPVMLEIMPETYGVMVYQEDVIKVAHYFAGLTLGEADVLRRGMSGKYRSRAEFQAVKEKFFDNCINEKGYSHELTAEIWRQTESFAGYAFAKGHSASYAVESYQSLFLKAYYPIEYMVATLNNGGGFYSREHYVHEALMCGAIIEAPCVNMSDQLTSISGKTVHLGFHMVKSLNDAVAKSVVEERKANGPFDTLLDLTERVSIGLEQVGLLIRSGALRSIEQNKKTLMWEAYRILNKVKAKEEQPLLFRATPKNYTLPTLTHIDLEDAFDQMEHLGFPLCNPFDLLKEPVDDPVRAHNIHEYQDQHVTVYGYLVTAKNTKTKKGDRMNFGNFIDRNGHFLDTVQFPSVAARYPYRGKGVYKVSGVVKEEFGFYTLEADYLERLPYVDDIRYVEETGRNEGIEGLMPGVEHTPRSPLKRGSDVGRLMPRVEHTPQSPLKRGSDVGSDDVE